MVTNNSGNIPTAASGKYLQGAGVGTAPAFSTATLPSTATGTGTLLRADGTNWVATTATFPNTAGTAGKVLISDGTNFVSSTPTFPNASASSGKFIRSDGTNWIASTPTLPTSAGTSGKVLQSDGTNYVETTATYPGSTTINQVLYSSSANTVTGLATANSGVLVTSSGGVPSISSTLPTGIVVPAGSGACLVLIQSQAASTSATIDFTSIGSYNNYMVVINQMRPVTNATSLQMKVSTNNGSTYITTGYVGGNSHVNLSTGAWTSQTSTSVAALVNSITNSAPDVSGVLYLQAMNSSDYPNFSGQFTFQNTTLAALTRNVVGSANTNTFVNAFQFLMSSGNISQGTFTLYGIRES